MISAVAIFASVTRAEPPATQPIGAAAVKFILSDGPAPCAIHLHALDVPLASGTPITAKYEWDFGDPAGRFNTLIGWNAAHVYDKPGRYVVQLRIKTESGAEQSFRGTLTVVPDSRRTIYVDPAGRDDNDGLSPDRPLRTVEGAAKAMASDIKILFRRGQTFDAGRTVDVRGSNVLIGAYGEGDRPVLMSVAGKGNIFSIDARARGVVIEQLTFDTRGAGDTNDARNANGQLPTPNKMWGKIGVSAVFARGTNIVVRDCRFLNVDDAINASGRPNGLLVADNVAPLETGLRGYFVWLQNSDTTIVGNRVANSTREHIVRSSSEQTQRVLIAHNHFTNAARKEDPDDIGKTTINLRACQYGYAARNELAGGPVAMGPSLDQPVNYLADSIVIEANRFNKNSLQIYPNTRRLFVRNNTFSKEDSEQILVRTREEDRKGGTVGVDERYVMDLWFVNNTGVNNSPRGKFIKVDGPPPKGAIVIANNLYVAPNLNPAKDFAAGMQVMAGDLSGFKRIAGNVWPGVRGKTFAGVNYVRAGLNNAGFVTNDAWGKLSEVRDDWFVPVPMADAFAPGRQVPSVVPVPGVYDDLNGVPRPADACTPGAIEIKK